MSVYLNNAATTWPKPPCVAEAVADFILRAGANLTRGTASRRDIDTLSTVMDCRERLAKLFGGYGGDPRYVTFCSGVTEALNLVLKGFLKPGMRVLSASMEHNAVVRPLRGLERFGICVEFLECDRMGILPPDVLKEAIKRGPLPGLIVLSHASNVCGTVQPVERIAEICGEFSIPLAVDGAQTGGVIPVNVSKLGISAFCFSGHKGLMGPQGLGGVIWNPEFALRVAPLVEGGTGSYSHIEVQPLDMPDKFEAGTPNLPGIAGLNAALGWIEKTGLDNIAAVERELGKRLLDGLKKAGAVVYGMPDMTGRAPVFAFNLPGFMDNGVLADRLSYPASDSGSPGFETRPGLHCSPMAHKTLGTFPNGSLRVSPGYFNTSGEIDLFAEALKEQARE